MHAFLLPIAIAAQPVPINLDRTLDGINAFKGAWVGMVVLDERGETVFKRNADLRFVPASNQKVLTCAFAMHAKGPEFRTQTRIWATESGVYIDSPGDPSITRDNWLAAAATVGRNPSGMVWSRQAYQAGIPSTWEHDDLMNRYAPRIASLSMDKAGFEIWAEGGALRPLPPELGVAVQVNPGTGAPRVTYDSIRGTVMVEGALPQSPTRLDTLAQPAPDLAVKRLFGSSFQETTSFPETQPTVTLTSPTFAELVRDCLQPSDNLYAEHLLLMASQNGPQVTYGTARDAMTKFLEDTVGVPKQSVIVSDGSGLSRHNMITPLALARLFKWSDRQPWAQTWRSALARPGVGTLRTRLEGVSFEGKTGTLNSVNSLSGYLTTKTGERLIVVLMVNHTAVSTAAVRAGIDQVYRTLENASFRGTRLGVK